MIMMFWLPSIFENLYKSASIHVMSVPYFLILLCSLYFLLGLLMQIPGSCGSDCWPVCLCGPEED